MMYEIMCFFSSSMLAYIVIPMMQRAKEENLTNYVKHRGIPIQSGPE